MTKPKLKINPIKQTAEITYSDKEIAATVFASLWTAITNKLVLLSEPSIDLFRSLVRLDLYGENISIVLTDTGKSEKLCLGDFIRVIIDGEESVNKPYTMFYLKKIDKENSVYLEDLVALLLNESANEFDIEIEFPFEQKYLVYFLEKHLPDLHTHKFSSPLPEANLLSGKAFLNLKEGILALCQDSITFCTMQNPVITPSGQTYEEEGLKEWLRKRPTDPNTQAPLSEMPVVENTIIKSIIQCFNDKTKTVNDLKKLFTCPLSNQAFIEPVVAFDGNTYSKAALIEFISKNPDSELAIFKQIAEVCNQFEPYKNYLLNSIIEAVNNSLKQKQAPTVYYKGLNIWASPKEKESQTSMEYGLN